MDREQEATTVPDSLAASEPFVGRWQQLVSTTNWEKGQIIHEWRAALMAENAPTTEFSDESWSQIVGGSITGQHAGRLRRTYERFGDVFQQYSGLFWSHFQSALDWEDAEMWLEGAVQNKWSVAGMRRERWKTTGADEADEPSENDIVAAEVDEDFSHLDDGKPNQDDESDTNANAIASGDFVAEATSPEGPDFGDADDDDVPAMARETSAPTTPAGEEKVENTVAPFADLPDLPEDVAGAFESYQLAILRHKGEEWSSISEADMLASLDALKALVTAP